MVGISFDGHADLAGEVRQIRHDDLTRMHHTSSWIPASAFRPLRGRKGDFVAVNPDKVGPQGAFITRLSVMNAG
jgi:hypothetical protein